MSAHTPGKWEITWRSMSPEIPSGISAGGKRIATFIENAGVRGAERRANARLIRAAPDLLAAIQSAQCDCSVPERDSGHKVGCWKPDADAAIAAATGRA